MNLLTRGANERISSQHQERYGGRRHPCIDRRNNESPLNIERSVLGIGGEEMVLADLILGPFFLDLNRENATKLAILRKIAL